MLVRLATIEDEPEILRLLQMLHAEGGMLPLDVDRAREMFARAFERRGGIIGVIGTPGSLRAMICLYMGQYWYTKESHLEEVMNFVSPEHRQSTYAKDLLCFARDCAEKMHIPLVIGVLTNMRMEAKIRLYRRIFGMPFGAFFVYGAKWVNLEPSTPQYWNREWWVEKFYKKSRAVQKAVAPVG